VISKVRFLLLQKQTQTNYRQATPEFISTPNDGGYAKHSFHR